MSNICKTVTQRTRKIKKGTQLSFYLDYYPGYRDESTMKVQRHESLGIYIFAKPKNQREKPKENQKDRHDGRPIIYNNVEKQRAGIAEAGEVGAGSSSFCKNQLFMTDKLSLQVVWHETCFFVCTEQRLWR